MIHKNVEVNFPKGYYLTAPPPRIQIEWCKFFCTPTRTKKFQNLYVWGEKNQVVQSDFFQNRVVHCTTRTIPDGGAVSTYI